MEPIYPRLRFDLERDCFVVWVRWVSMESPPAPEHPPNQGIRVELVLNRNSLLGPTILSRHELSTPVFLRANTARTREVIRQSADRAIVDLQLTIHGSVANAPYAAVYQVRDYEGAAIDTNTIEATPLLQLQPSTPGDQWHVAGQSSVRMQLDLIDDRVRLNVVQ